MTGDPCPYTVGRRHCYAGAAGHPGRHDWPSWERVGPGEQVLRAESGAVLATLNATGSRLATDRYRFRAGPESGTAGTIETGRDAAERAALRQVP